MSHPKVRVWNRYDRAGILSDTVLEFVKQDNTEPQWDYPDDGDYQLVPLGGVHLYRDENGEWPMTLLANAARLVRDDRPGRPTMLLILDALEAALAAGEADTTEHGEADTKENTE